MIWTLMRRLVPLILNLNFQKSSAINIFLSEADQYQFANLSIIFCIPPLPSSHKRK